MRNKDDIQEITKYEKDEKCVGGILFLRYFLLVYAASVLFWR